MLNRVLGVLLVALLPACLEFGSFVQIRTEWVDCDRRVAVIWSESGDGGPMVRSKEIACETLAAEANAELRKACDFDLPRPAECGVPDVRDVIENDSAIDSHDSGDGRGDSDRKAEYEVTNNCPDSTAPCRVNVWDEVALECVEMIAADALCDDDDSCTEGDKCDASGMCAGVAIDCNDGIECTTEQCVASQGCVYDGSSCECDEDSDCLDEDVCTDDVCDLATWSCSFPVGVGSSCDDLDPCTGDDQCNDGGVCVGVAKNCDDGEACTVDSCNGLSGACEHEPLPDGTFCEANDVCQVEAICDLGSCGSGYLSAFESVYPSPSPPLERYFDDVVKVPGGYLGASRLATEFVGVEGAQLTTFGLDGAELSSSPLGDTPNSYTRTSMAVHSGAIYLAYLDSTQPGDWQLSEIDPNGAVIWTSPQTDGTSPAGLTSSSGVLASVSNGPSGVSLSSHDPTDGAVLWSMPFAGQARRLVPAASGFALLSSGNVHLRIIDAFGSILGEESFPEFNANDIAVTPTGFAVVGSALNNLSAVYEPGVVLVGPTGSVLKTIVIKPDAGSAEAAVWSSGSLFVLGESLDPSDGLKSWLVRYDTSAEQPVWETTPMVTKSYGLRAIDAGIYLLGSSYPDGYLSRVSLAGETSCP